MANHSLDGRVAVVTGASRGLGKQMAMALAEAGATVALVARSEELLEKVKVEIESHGGKAHAFFADLREENEVARMARQVSDAAGAPDILINNTCINRGKTQKEFTLKE